MTDQPAAGIPVAKTSSFADPSAANAQTIVSMAIVCALSLIGLAAIGAALVEKSVAAVAFGTVGVVVGSLATALNAPTGLGNVIAQAKKAPDNG